MKFVITLKDPDGVYDSLEDAGIIKSDGTAKDEDAKAFCDTFIEWGEYVYLEVDTDAKTVRVMGVNE